jgi:hypothetical protein
MRARCSLARGPDLRFPGLSFELFSLCFGSVLLRLDLSDLGLTPATLLILFPFSLAAALIFEARPLSD